ncbi:MAG TPA: VOC family protein [Rhodocyclaceae bacterium]|nr:VOC family protein [Rhodocyclaceae bacterium]
MATVKPIPEGMGTITAHLVCHGAARAIDFYKQAFDAVELGRQAMPGSDKLLHASLRIGDTVLMLMDDFPEWGAMGPTALKGSPVTLHLYVPDVDAMVKRAAEAGAKITMPAEETFWGDRYAKLEDPFGHHWSVATHVRDVSAAEMEQAAMERFGQNPVQSGGMGLA